MDGEIFELRWWNSESNEEMKLSPTKFIIGERLSYLADGVLVLEIEPVVSIPHEYFLSATYPNPFNSSARIDYGLPEAGFLSIKVYDIAGRIVFTLFDGRTAAGQHSAVWDATANVSGVYFIHMKAAEFSSVEKLLLVR